MFDLSSYWPINWGTVFLDHPVYSSLFRRWYGLTIYFPVANFLQSICAKNYENYENWLAVDKVIAKITRLTFLAHPVHTYIHKYCSAPFTIKTRPMVHYLLKSIVKLSTFLGLKFISSFKLAMYVG